jgi:threonine/homoserine/homoserine lactone efflux protein
MMVKIDLLRTMILLALCWFGLAANAQTVMLAILICYSAGCAVLLFAMRHYLISRKS